ncbi:DnaD domain-containing protein [Bacillus pseudomycoides]|uniref:Replication protein n=1 Tax=Bacillus pseudomycoides TaxID=64104 RepID=A0A2B5HSX6_9BACI|nr:DnaD domain protein [Bacillus pseudomycoides]PEA84736.1 replication protein [Bacillus pseudomycoides]PED71553.1 replication protein [Bacillus pseudomycoides]PEI40301.1 replication protein [Bacillus pseudomycoides]PEJ73226.1 replication protein [Bacillus pseudomycoides]PEM19804.1 replication protein [Bacillus pseudomycoides]
MAVYRPVQVSFWQDAKVIKEMTPEDKLFNLYLLTNPCTTQIGVYQITKKQMAFDLGYSMESINALLDRFENHHKLVKYNPETRELAIINWGKYNLNRGGKPIEDCVRKELDGVTDISLISLVTPKVKNDKIRAIFEDFLAVHDTCHDTLTISGEKEKEKEKEKQQQEERTDVVEVNPISFYEQNFGFMTPFIAEGILAWVDDLNVELVVKAMEIALEKNTRNMSYVNSILRDWHVKGFKTVTDVEVADKEFRAKRTTQVKQQPAYQSVAMSESTKQVLQQQKEWHQNIATDEELAALNQQNGWMQ